VSHQIALSIIPDEQIINIVEYGRGEFQLRDKDEGSGLEQSAHGCLESIYSQSTFRSPQVGQGKSKRELTDLIGFDNGVVCIVESKALSILGINQPRPTFKRVRSIQKDIKKAIRQLRGAIRKLRSDDEILDEQGNTIDIPNRSDSVIHALILLSEMNAPLDWKMITDALLEASDEKRKIFFHILDLIELQRLTAYSRHSSFTFHINLLSRWGTIKQVGTAFISTKVSPYE